MAHFTKATSVHDWFNQRLGIDTVNRVLATEYWIPKNINFLWAMGMILAITFAILLVSGIFLLMYYQPNIHTAFDSVNYTIMQQVDFGWMWRHVHAVSASVVFLIIYIHMFTGIYYGSYKNGREMIWISGMLLFVAFSAEAFSGYMLPWGQMSYWAGMVITNLFSLGSLHLDGLVEWIRGDYVPAQAFLDRFFMLHVVLIPLVIIALIGLHFGALRLPHVNNQDGEELDFDVEAKKYLAGNKAESKVIRFVNDFLSKDMMVVGIYLIFLFYLVFWHFNFAMDPINFDPANGLQTPRDIYPEWYFLWSYEMLRPFSTNFGLISFAFAQAIMFLLPFLDRSKNAVAASRRGLFKYWFWALLIDMIALSAMGKMPPSGIYYDIGFTAASVFIGLWVLLPIITIYEKKA
jgi:ubiquinol-cytochrome c reductase cytochrome b subunit